MSQDLPTDILDLNAFRAAKILLKGALMSAVTVDPSPAMIAL